MADEYEEIIQRLRSLGLSLYEAKAYIVVLKKRVTTSTEISKEAGIPQPRIYDVIRSLESKGLIVVSDGRPRLIRAVEPDEGLKRLADRIISKVNENYRSLTSILSTFYRSGEREHTEGIWRIDGAGNVFEELESVSTGAEHELLISLYRSMIKKVQSTLKELYRRGVSICVVIYDSKEPVENVDEQYYKKTRGNIIVISDRRKMLFSTPTFKNEEPELSMGYTTENQSLIKMFAEYFIHNLTDLAEPVRIAYGDTVFERSFVHIPRAIRMINSLQSRGFKPVVYVQGRFVKSGNSVELRGVPIELIYDVKEGVGRILLKTDDNLYTVGGWGAYLEDVEAYTIRVSAEK